MEQDRTKKARVLLSKIGLDGHDRGVKMLAKLLTDAGVEVVYLGLFQSPEKIVRAAIEEDVDIVGLSIHSGEHKAMVPSMLQCMEKEGIAQEIPLIVGGCIPWEDVPVLKKQGVREVFPAGTLVRDIIAFIEEASGTGHSPAQGQPA